MRRNIDQHEAYPWQITDEELDLAKSIGIPRSLRPVVAGDAAASNARTSAFRKIAAAARAEAEMYEAAQRIEDAKVGIARASLEAKEIEVGTIDGNDLRRKLASATSKLATSNLERDAAIQDAHEKTRLLEIAKGHEALAVHAEGTSR